MMKRSLGALTATALVAAGLTASPSTALAAPGPATAVPTPVLVARYTFDGGIVAGRVAEVSRRGSAATVRAAAGGKLTVGAVGTNRYVSFPGACRTTTTACARVVLEAPDDADLDPGLRRFRWAARIAVVPSQVTDSSNVVQKGVDNGGSLWKMQIGPRKGLPQCAVFGASATQHYVVRSKQPISDGQWHRVQCERNGKSLAIAVDGVITGRGVVPATLSISNNKPLRIGGPNLTNTGDMFHGRIDEVFATVG
jgi:hypothetical protein